MKEQTNIVNPQRIKPTVYRKIQEDYDLRVTIANEIDIRESTLYMAAYRNSKLIENYFVIESFKKNTGWKSEEIFEEDSNSQNQTNDKRNKSRKSGDHSLSTR